MLSDIKNVYGCSCGKDHILTTKHFIIEKDAAKKIPLLLKELGVEKTPLCVYDKNTFGAIGGKIQKHLKNGVTYIVEGENIHPDENVLEGIQNKIKEIGASVVLGMGGGVITDASRHSAFLQKVPFVSVPTCASVDGFASGSSALSLGGGKVTLPSGAPIAVVCDLETIAAAPKYLTASGVGDMLAKYIAIADWRIGKYVSGEYYCDYIADLQLDATNAIMDSIDDIAAGGMDGTGKLMEGLLLSGLAMQMSGITRPASSFEHHFSHFLEVVPFKNADKNALHGEKVGIASILAANYFKSFVLSLKKIPDENKENMFDLKKVTDYFSQFGESTVNWVIKENSPTISRLLDKNLLKENYKKVLECCDIVPSGEKMKEILRKLGGKTSCEDINISKEECLELVSHCCYIRNRFTLLRLVCDFKTYEFEKLLY